MINKLSVFVLMCFVYFSISCRKEKLNGDEMCLAGKWNWLSTIIQTWELESGSHGQGGYGRTIYSPIDIGSDYALEFTENGRVNYFENGQKVKDSRFRFLKSGINKYGEFSFVIQVNWKPWDPVAGVIHVAGDTLKTTMFYPELKAQIEQEKYDKNTIRVTNVYVKE